jgi:hypothetical protein
MGAGVRPVRPEITVAVGRTLPASAVRAIRCVLRVASRPCVFVTPVVVRRPEVITLAVTTPLVVAVRRVAASVRLVLSRRPVPVAVSWTEPAATRITLPVPVARVIAVALSIVLAGGPARVARMTARVVPAIGLCARAISITVFGDEPIAWVEAVTRTVCGAARTARCIARPRAITASVRSETVAWSVCCARAVIVPRRVAIARAVLIRARPAAITPVSAIRPVSASGVRPSVGPVASTAVITRTSAVAGRSRAGTVIGARSVARVGAVPSTSAGSWPISSLGSVVSRAVTAARRVSVTSRPVVLSRPVLLPRSVPFTDSVTRFRRLAVARGRSVSVRPTGHRAARRLTTSAASGRAARRRNRSADDRIGRTTREAAFHRALPGQPAAIIGPDLRAPARAFGTVFWQRLWPRPDSMNLRLRLPPLALLVPGPLLWSWPYPLGPGFVPGRPRLTVLLSARLRMHGLLRRRLLGRRLLGRRLLGRRLLGLRRCLSGRIRTLLCLPTRSLRNHRLYRLHCAERREPLVGVGVGIACTRTLRRGVGLKPKICVE